MWLCLNYKDAMFTSVDVPKGIIFSVIMPKGVVFSVDMPKDASLQLGGFSEFEL